MGLIENFGKCLCCGQIRMVQFDQYDIDHLPEEPEQVINQRATEECGCAGARERTKIIEIAQSDIDAMLTTTMPEISKWLCEGVPLLYDEKIKKVTVKIPGNITVNLYRQGKGIKIKHETKKTTELLSE